MHRLVLAGAIALSACRAEDPFVCASDEQCRRSGVMGGRCEASFNCSFPDQACDTGRRYDALATNAGQCVLDDDHDMIADDGDNCVGITNPMQEDEDNDGRGDPCDPCPPFSEQTQGAGDDDGDGVGNLCDPSATTANKILLFEGFHAPLPATWTVNGSAIIENDGCTLQNAADATVPVPSAGTEAMYVGVELKTNPATGAWLGIAYQSGVGGAYCELTTSKLQLWGVGAPNRLIKETDFAASLNKEYVYGMKRLGPMQFACTGSAVPTASPIEVSGMTLSSPTAPAVQIGADVTTRFAWVLLIGNQ